ncbi:hypothetical protein TIFTF001_033772 [Ficus carica]|uniref:FAR1 domain-containing protein n=1 Tax=Ficus carica TaxID=3494 RepID=A0AA88DZ88_FICCA|nr:hypothetical protein TIFTF001_033772 [Ficus carica]
MSPWILSKTAPGIGDRTIISSEGVDIIAWEIAIPCVPERDSPRNESAFWEQFLTERPGQKTIENNQNETANEEDESSLRSNEDGMESGTAPSDHECGQILVVPQCGMEFPSEERAYNFYKNYAARLGFNVRKGKVQRMSNGMIQKRILLCSKEGERSKKISGKTPRYKRKETRTGCKAEIRIELKNGKWVIYSCSLEHNHELERPGQSHEMDTYPDNSQVVARESTGDGAQVVDEEGGTAENRSPEEDLFADCLYEDRSKQDFEETWNRLMEVCKLREDPWLAIVYKSREKWSHLFCEELSFAADLESILKVGLDFDIFPRWKNATLADIFEEYLETTEQFRSRELLEDFEYNAVQFKLRIGMDKHAADVYTCNVFEEFEWEFEKIKSLAIEESVASEETRKIVERHLDSALQETEEYQKKKFWCTDLRGDEICCGERHCPFGKKKKIGSASSSGNEVHGS